MKKNKFQIKREETFESFIDAGLHLLIDRAYDTVSIDEISKAAGYSKGAFYVHFESKEDFLKHLLDRHQIKKRIITGYLDEIERQSARPLTLYEAARSAADLLMHLINSKPAWNIVSFALHMPNYKVVQEYEAYIRLYELWIEESCLYINWLKSRNLIEEQIDTEYTARMMCALIDGMIKQSNVLGRSVTFRSLFDALSVFFSNRKSG
ncbi:MULTISPECIES: TetR/AcrR family transcriptional regulator [Bacillus]|jgi:AcrR family transcriptional regulator|uniref:A-factor receptor protein A-factor-binding protein n=1 Tax=Bacillus amyloliquefaciens (strain ATCC 23350 / DSM 7 / BCRC 11601 / CCUG 28519 / NBRC 15535 / NRRL B-14393 / F) TaxID=692420 RepID=A0A9P1NJK8_BACAS|nr:TetR/AcrR family transcriptional regulator [Bacillus amyloliquefaciens]AIW35636.1 TetR family transcriptional regulator [Bacillus subtilis]AEB26019.1 A-factor receptor protein A-factor-binding protein [Bacillus amyloliquefaciens TA208]AEB65495.1 A-factor receptor protein A-factor-binding protein [Bacillus amyloliquefaciens LL3]AEK91072.1 putative transcriptional regulator [Bacillus amyloliquefaciens XH7]ARW41017.1 putative HTH-type transcriptional regulator YwcC [Bacillus amyloliquefaciens]